MKREFAKPIAQGLGVVVVSLFMLAVWYFDLQLGSWPRWAFIGLLVGSAAILVYTAIQTTKRLP